MIGWVPGRAIVSGTLVALGCLVLAGCCKANRAKECAGFIQLINKSLEPANAADRATDNPQTLATASVTLAKASVEIKASCNNIAAARYNDDQLMQFGREFVVECRKLAAATDRAATAAANGDRVALIAANLEINALKKNAVVSLIPRVEMYCSGG